VVAGDGSIRWMACRGRTMRDDEGDVARIVGIVTDITDRHRVEEALRATEERLRQVVANAPIVLFAFDARGRITLAEGAAMPNVGADIVVPGSEVAASIERVLQGESFRADVAFGGAVYDTWYQPLTDDDGGVVGGFGVSTDVTERRRVESKLAHQAVHDPLTGLPNRVLFLDRLGQALKRGGRKRVLTAVLFLDLDRFKLVNDSFGHPVGDEVLLVAAERLRALVRPADTVARFGGDEFVVLCEDLVGELEAVGIAERIVDGLRQPARVGGVEIYLSTSIGIAISRGDDQTPDDMIRDADVAMYRAKERGRARWEVFDAGMRDRAVHQLGIRNGLPFALMRDELRLHYQPAVRLGDGAMRGAEALVRWQHPDYGLMPPADFIPAAEEAGFMREIGLWVLTEACRQVTRWNRLVRPALTVAVNLSANQLHEPDLLDDVTRVLADTGTAPADVCLEIAEGSLLSEPDRVLSVLRGLKDLGVLLAIDDFGAGQSALGYLRRLPVDILKLDRTLAEGLRDPRGVAVVRAVIDMSHALGFTVVAEGVETSGQVDQLAELGCDLAQGYFLGRPDEASAMSGLLR
jgi:diguanylate cyclase (GGDEF)-like protein